MEDKICKVRLSKEKITSILEKIRAVRVGVVGDGCLDIYWDADMRLSELSRETPHYPLPVVRERMYPGGGSNVAVNAKSLGAASVYMLTLLGNDWRRDCLISKLEEYGIDNKYILSDNNWISPTYCKPMRKGYSDVVYEDPRIDFENRAPLAAEQETNIIDKLNELSENVDVIAVCDQFKYGVISGRVRDELKKLALKGKKIIVDSRSKIGLFNNVIIKPNELEAMTVAYDGNIPEDLNFQVIIKVAVRLYKNNRSPVIITLGDKGALWHDGESFYLAEGIPVEPPVDTVGAGDTFLAAFSCAYGAGIEGPEAIAFANLASSIIIKKIGMTGTATPEEIVYKLENMPGMPG